MTTPSSNIKTKDDDHCGKGCPTWLVLIIPLLMILILVVPVILVIVLIPPTVFPEVEITYASVSNTNVTAVWDVKFLVYNPNKVVLICEDFQGYLYYKNSPLKEVIIPKFSLGKKNQTTVKAMFPDTKDSSHMRVVKEEEEAIHGGMLHLNLWMWGYIKYKTPIERQLIWSRIICDNLLFQFSGNTSGTLLGGTYHCVVVKAGW